MSAADVRPIPPSLRTALRDLDRGDGTADFADPRATAALAAWRGVPRPETPKPKAATVTKSTAVAALTKTRPHRTAPNRQRSPLACGCPDARHASGRCAIPADYDPAEGWDRDAGSPIRTGCGCSPPPIETLPAMPEPEALPYNPLLSRRRWPVPMLG